MIQHHPFLTWLDEGAPPRQSSALDAVLADLAAPESEALTLLRELRQRPQQAALAAEAFARRLETGDPRTRWFAARALGVQGLNARYLEEEFLRRLLAHQSRPEAWVTTVALLSAWGCQAPAFITFATTYLDALLSGGSQGRALRIARSAGRHAREEGAALPLPPSPRPAAELKGAWDLTFEDYALRDITPLIGGWLGAVCGEIPGLVPWIFEGIKLWGAHERGPFLEAMVGCGASPGALSEGIASLLAFARQDAEFMDRPREMLSASVDDPALLAPLLAGLAEDPQLSDLLAPRLYGSELGEALRGERPPWMAEGAPPWLLALAAHPTPLVSALALSLAARDGATAPRLAESLAALLGAEALGERLSPFVARAALLAGLPGASRDAAQGALARGWGSAGARELIVHALAKGQERGFEILSSEGAYHLMTLPVSPAGPVVAAEGGFYVAYRRVLMPTPRDDWMTDRDEVGVLYLSPAAPEESRLYPLPLALPVRETGGAGVKRSAELRCPLGSALVLSLATPFSDERGWGTENRAFAFSPKEGTFRALVAEGETLAPGAILDGGALQAEDATPPICFGEMLLWNDGRGAVRVAADGTPYHLDDWEQSEAVVAATAAMRAAEGRLDWEGWEVEGGQGQLGIGKKPNMAVAKGPTRIPLPGARAFIAERWPGIRQKGTRLFTGSCAISHAQDGGVVLLRVYQDDGSGVDGALILSTLEI